MAVPKVVRRLSAAFIGMAIFLLTLSVAYQQYPWGSWRPERNYAKRQLELAQLNLDEKIATRGAIPASIDEIYRADEWPRDIWEFPLTCERKGDRYELKSLGSDGQPGGFGRATDLTVHDDFRNVTMPTPVQFLLQCMTVELWLNAVITGLITAGMVMMAPIDSPRLPVANFLVALLLTGFVSWFVGTTLMAIKVGPQH